jgi:hypothetical protein
MLLVGSVPIAAKPSLLLVAAKAPAVFSDQVIHGIDLDGLARNDALHLRVLSLELLQSNDVAHVHPGVLRLPKTDGVDVNAVSAR